MPLIDEEKRICNILRDEILRGIHLLYEARERLRPREALRIMRIIDHLADARERICRGE